MVRPLLFLAAVRYTTCVPMLSRSVFDLLGVHSNMKINHYPKGGKKEKVIGISRSIKNLEEGVARLAFHTAVRGRGKDSEFLWIQPVQNLANHSNSN
ncbi:hypothetical protein B0H67DRAFT_559705 [Lasiosphaeris hirsuta]|uniref:Uncharacterized protein n=1 Tax=Lasiosphaeris hirsuta TaxID=260670 RepID=A0AA40B960_9PEZI|nr:hypothetical protein B0H67DRAFT_559705 [Lasiosphaeris hirsuta]